MCKFPYRKCRMKMLLSNFSNIFSYKVMSGLLIREFKEREKNIVKKIWSDGIMIDERYHFFPILLKEPDILLLFFILTVPIMFGPFNGYIQALVLFGVTVFIYHWVKKTHTGNNFYEQCFQQFYIQMQ